MSCCKFTPLSAKATMYQIGNEHGKGSNTRSGYEMLEIVFIRAT